MKGTLPKHLAGRSLDCHRCNFFRDEDEDIYYCELDHSEFPKQCSEFLSQDDELCHE